MVQTSVVRIREVVWAAAIALLSLSTPVFSAPLRVTMFLVPERAICFGKTAFSECVDVSQVEFESFLSRLYKADKNPITFEIPDAINLKSSDERKSVLMSVRSYAQKVRLTPATAARAAVFLVDLPKGVIKNVSLTQFDGQNMPVRPENETVTPGRYVTWVNATNIDPEMNARFELRVSGTRLTFRFVS